MAPQQRDNDLLKRVCDIVFPMMLECNWTRALANAWFYFIQKDSSVAVRLADSGKGNFKQLVDKVSNQKFNSANDLCVAILPAPLSLIAALDLLTGSIAGRSLEQWGCQVNVIGDRTIYTIADKFGGNHAAHTQKQDQQFRRFHPNTLIIDSQFDPSSDERRVSVRDSDALVRAFTGIDSALRVYLAEFHERPNLQATLETRPGDDGSWFTVVGLHNIEKLSGELLKHLARADEKACHVIVFPELSVPPEFHGRVKSWLQENAPANLKLVVAGSFHVKIGDGVVNRCRIFGANGSEVRELQQDKLLPVSLPTEDSSLHEHITCDSTVRLVSSPFGMMAVAICLDLGQLLPSAIPYEQLPISWLWVPSMSKKTTMHLSNANGLFLAQGTRSLCANQSGIQVNGATALRSKIDPAIHTSFACFSASSSAVPLLECADACFRIYDVPLPVRPKQS